MPVDYTIASRVAPASGGMDPLNAFAQMQGLSYRQQQNALAQMQMQKLQQELEAQQAIRGMAGGINMNDPRVVNQIWAQDPEFARQIYASQLAGMREQRMAEQAAASTANIRAEQALRQREFEELKIPKSQLESEKLGLEKQKLGAEITREERAGKKLEFEINKEALDRDAKVLERLENQAAKIYNMNGKGYEAFRSAAAKENPAFETMLPPQYDADALAGFVETASSTRERLKSAGDYELREIQDASGATRIVAIPKKAPQMGAVSVPGAGGQKPPQYSFSPGPQGSGAMFRGDSRTGVGELFTPGQPGMPMPANAMAPAPLLPQTSFTNAPPPTQATPPQGVIGIRGRAGAEPTPTAPLGSAERGRQDVMQQVLQAGGYNPDTGVDIVEPLLSRASSGMLSAKGTDIGRMFGANSAAAAADTELKRVSADLTQAFAGNRLATAGVAASEADRFEKQAADIGNPNLTIGERLAAYRGIKRNATRLLGSQYVNPYDKSGMTQETMLRARVEETPEGEFTVADPDGGVHRFGNRKQAAEFLSYVQRMTLGKR